LSCGTAAAAIKREPFPSKRPAHPDSFKRWSGGNALAWMRGDLPGVTPFVFHHPATIPIVHIGWLLERTRTSVEGALIRRVSVVDVNVEKGGHGCTDTRIADHDDRVPDPDLGWNRLPIISCRAGTPV